MTFSKFDTQVQIEEDAEFQAWLDVQEVADIQAMEADSCDEEFDGQPDERQEWDDFRGGDEYYDHSEYEYDRDCMYDC